MKSAPVQFNGTTATPTTRQRGFSGVRFSGAPSDTAHFSATKKAQASTGILASVGGGFRKVGNFFKFMTNGTNLRTMGGFTFKYAVPTLVAGGLGLSFLGGPLGCIGTIALVPIGWASTALGGWMLNGVMKNSNGAGKGAKKAAMTTAHRFARMEELWFNPGGVPGKDIKTESKRLWGFLWKRDVAVELSETKTKNLAQKLSKEFIDHYNKVIHGVFGHTQEQANKKSSFYSMMGNLKKRFQLVPKSAWYKRTKATLTLRHLSQKNFFSRATAKVARVFNKTGVLRFIGTGLSIASTLLFALFNKNAIRTAIKAMK